MHPIAEIEAGKLTPSTKTAVPSEGRDATLQATTMIAEIMAHVRTDANVWHKWTMQLVRGTTDMRAAFIKGLSKHLSDMRKANTEATAQLGKDGKPNPTKEETKVAGKLVSSATQYCTKLRYIAHAFNSGATEEGLEAYILTRNRTKGTAADVSWFIIAEYADTFKDSDARGRKADPFTVKLSKWLDKNPAGEGDKSGAALHAVISKLVADQLAKDTAF